MVDRVQKQPQEVFYKKSVLKNFAKLTRKQSARASFLLKLQASAFRPLRLLASAGRQLLRVLYTLFTSSGLVMNKMETNPQRKMLFVWRLLMTNLLLMLCLRNSVCTLAFLFFCWRSRASLYLLYLLRKQDWEVFFKNFSSFC